MKIKLAQINPRVGDLEGNFQKAVEMMKDSKADLVIFPELSVTGYPPKDLLEKWGFVHTVRAYANKWAELSKIYGRAMIFGSVLRRENAISGKKLWNVAHFARRGVIETTTAKTLLPTYDVFDEARYFEPAPENKPLDFGVYRLGISICEDAWNDKEFWKEQLYPVDPIKNLVNGGCGLLVNISASPYAMGKPEIRRKMLSHIAKKYDKPLIYVNQVGGNDDVVYDGRSWVFGPDGSCLVQLSPFREAAVEFDLDHALSNTGIDESFFSKRIESEEIFDALVLGTRDYAQKTGFKKALIGLSGGIDSAIVAVIAAQALGKENVLGVGMPSKYSSEGSVSDAQIIAQKLGIGFALIPIKPAHAAYMEMLGPRLKPPAHEPKDVELWEENIQARIRGAALMAISNAENRLLLTTGNKSEVAVGYCTLYGDTCGGLAVISDVFKTKVYALARWINENKGEIIPKNSIDKPPSAELRPNQKDQDSLPPYPFLDCILGLYIEEQMEVDQIISYLDEHDCQIPSMPSRKEVEDIVRKVDRNEYKRRQLAPGLKVTKKAFGTGRQMPIAQGWH